MVVSISPNGLKIMLYNKMWRNWLWTFSNRSLGSSWAFFLTFFSLTWPLLSNFVDISSMSITYWNSKTYMWIPWHFYSWRIFLLYPKTVLHSCADIKLYEKTQIFFPWSLLGWSDHAYIFGWHFFQKWMHIAAWFSSYWPCHVKNVQKSF